MLRKLTAAFVSTALVSSSVLAATPKIDTSLFPSANSKIYVAQGLLHDDKSWDVAYEILRDIIKNDETINKVSRKKVKKAASLIRNYNIQKPILNAINMAQYKSRPYVEAQMYLAEALMDSRLFLNQSYDTEVIFVEKLLKNYFYPLQGDKVTIHYPAPSTYAFNTWAMTKENLEKAQTGVAVENEGFFDFLDEKNSAASKQKSTTSTSSSSSSSNNNSGTPQKGVKKPPFVSNPPTTTKFPPTNNSGQYQVPAYGSNKGGTSADQAMQNVDDPNAQDKGIIEDAAEIVDVVVEVSDRAEELMNIYEEYEKKSDRINNKYLGQSMLVQAIAEPGSVLVDPQLQAFVKGVSIEYSLGEVDMPKQLELEELNDNLGEQIFNGDTMGKVSIDLTKLYQLNRNGSYSNLKLEFREQAKSGKGTLFVISSLSGEDLMFNRVLQHAASLAQNSEVVANTKAADVAVKAVNTIPKFFAHMGEAVSKTIKYGQEADKLGKMGTIWNGSKMALVQGLKVANAPKVAFTKIASSPTMQKILDKTVRTNFVKSGKLFHSLVALGLIAEITTGIIEYNNAETAEEKKDAREEALARTGAQLVYLVPYVGAAAMTVDFLHYTMGLPIETADVFRGAGYLGESIGLWMAGYNHTTYRLLELELEYEVPRHEVYIVKHAYNLESVADAVEAKQSVLNSVQDAALKNLVVIYRAHRSFGEKQNYDFGQRLAEYREHFQTMNIEKGHWALEKIEGQIAGLRLKEKVNQTLSEVLDISVE